MKIVNRLASLLIGSALAVAGVITVIEVVLLVTGRPPLIVPRHQWDHYLARAAWSSTWILIPAVVATVVGVVLATGQLVPRRPVRLSARSAPARDVWVSRRGLARRVAATVDTRPGVAGARVKVTRRRVTARVTAVDDRPVTEAHADLVRAITDLADLDGVTARRPPRVRLSASRPRAQ